MTATRKHGPVYGDGFIPYHYSVLASNPDGSVATFRRLIDTIKDLKSFVRSGDATPENMLAQLRAVPGVEAVFVEGPYSSIVIPMCMVRSLGGTPAILSGVIGTGPFADAIGASLETMDVRLDAKVVTVGDTPVEISVRDNCGHQQAVRLYPASRSRYRHTFRLSDSQACDAAGLIVTRFNQGRARAMQQVAEAGGFTSLRISGATRYISFHDYLSMIPHAQHVVVTHRDGLLTRLARHLNIDSPDPEWTQRLNCTTQQIVERLREQSESPLLVILVLQKEIAFCPPTGGSLRFEPPADFDNRSRAARIQGACAAVAVSRHGDAHPSDLFGSSETANLCVQAAFDGTMGRPSRYPARDFSPSSSWRVPESGNGSAALPW